MRAISIAPIIVEKIEKKARSLSRGSPAGHKGKHSILVVHKLGKDLARSSSCRPAPSRGQVLSAGSRAQHDRSIPGLDRPSQLPSTAVSGCDCSAA